MLPMPKKLAIKGGNAKSGIRGGHSVGAVTITTGGSNPSVSGAAGKRLYWLMPVVIGGLGVLGILAYAAKK